MIQERGMSTQLDYLKSVAQQLRQWARQSEGVEFKRLLERMAAAVDGATAEIELCRHQAQPLPSRIGDLSDLPPELRQELSGAEIDEFEEQLISVINAYGGTADLNQVLVGLFRKFQVVQKRRFVQQKLWRMTTDELLWPVPKRKGVYSTHKPGSPRPESPAASAPGAGRDAEPPTPPVPPSKPTSALNELSDFLSRDPYRRSAREPSWPTREPLWPTTREDDSDPTS
jgi:hypothetical protein